VRLLVCSIDKAEQIGLNWWRTDPRLTTNVVSSLPASDMEARLMSGSDTRSGLGTARQALAMS